MTGKKLKKYLCALLQFFFLGVLLFSQNKPVLLPAEISSIEKKLADPKLPPAERKQSLETMARIFELSGNFEAAADAWHNAARTVSGNAGHADFLQSARCYAAIGEFEKAETVLKPVLSASGSGVLQNKARLLSAQMEALRTGNTAALSSLLSNSDFAGDKPVLYFSLWRISGDPGVKASIAHRLLAEFPQSPEARIVQDGGAVSASSAALWFFMGSGPSIPGPAVVQVPAAPSGGTASGGPLMLQTGYFSREENARNMAGRLNNSGFNSVIDKKTVSGNERWIVGVEPGPDYLKTMSRLKEKGFDSFPVY